MAEIPCSVEDREYGKFDKRCSDDAVGVNILDGGMFNSLRFDDVERSSVSSTQNKWTLRWETTDIAEILLTYASTSKEDVIRAQFTKLVP